MQCSRKKKKKKERCGSGFNRQAYCNKRVGSFFWYSYRQ